MGFPRGEKEILCGKRAPRSNEIINKWRFQFGKKKQEITIPQVSTKLNSTKATNMWFKYHFLVLLVSTMIQSHQNKNANYKFLPNITDVSKVAEFNWCKYVIDSLVEGTRSWKPGNFFTGPLAFLIVSLIYLLDNFLLFATVISIKIRLKIP